VDTVFASFGQIVGSGAVAALYYANRMIQFPTAIFGIALATACLPTMSRQAADENYEQLKQTLAVGMRGVMVFLIPSTVGLIVLARPLVQVLFERGEFDVQSTVLTAFTMAFYSIGIIAYSGSRMVTTCFYSLQDTRTPVRITGICLIANTVMNYLLMWPLQAGGLALATSLSAMLNFGFLIWFLRKKIGALGITHTMCKTLPVVWASLLMGLICHVLYGITAGSALLRLAISVVAGVLVFLIAGWLLGAFKGFRFRQ